MVFLADGAELARVHIGWPDGKAHAHRLGHIREWSIEPAAVGQHRGDELRRIVGPQVAGVLRDADVGTGVPLAEAVAGKGEHHRPHLHRHLRVAAQRRRAGEEFSRVGGELLGRPLLGERLAQAIARRQRHAGERGADIDHVLLEHHHAERLGQRIPQDGIEWRVWRAMQPLEVDADVAVGGGADDAGVEHQQLEGVGARLDAQDPRRRALGVEDTHRLPGAEERAGRLVLLGIAGGVVDLPPGADPHRLDRVADHRQRAVAQQVDLHQPRIFGAVLLELDHRHRKVGGAVECLGRPFQRHKVSERTGDDHHAAGMQREMPRHPDQRLGQPGQLLPHRRQVEALEVGMRAEQVGERGVVAEPGKAAGHLANLARRAAPHLRDLPQGAAHPEAVVIRHHRRAGQGIGPEDVGQDLVALVPRKVEVDIRRVLPLRIEKPLEEQSGA